VFLTLFFVVKTFQISSKSIPACMFYNPRPQKAPQNIPKTPIAFISSNYENPPTCRRVRVRFRFFRFRFRIFFTSRRSWGRSPSVVPLDVCREGVRGGVATLPKFSEKWFQVPEPRGPRCLMCENVKSRGKINVLAPLTI